MGFNFNFRDISSHKDLQMLVDFLIKQDLGYPQYESWVQRTEHELDTGYKNAILAFSDGHLVGDLIYQPHKELPNIGKIKNLRIHPGVRRRYFAQFMLRQVEIEQANRFSTLLVDVRSNQSDVITAFRVAGYTEVLRTPLYDPNIEDVVMTKCFDKTTEMGILHKTRRLILG